MMVNSGPYKHLPMNPPYLRRALFLSAILLVALISYRQTASGSTSLEKNSTKPLSVTAAAKLAGKNSTSAVIVKGLLKKSPRYGSCYLVDEDSISTHPMPLSCFLATGQGNSLDGLEDGTELVLEGRLSHSMLKQELTDCLLISINNGTVYTDHFPEQ